MARDSTSGKSRADRNRAIRQEELRKQLAAGKHLEHLVDMIEQLRDFDQELTSIEVQRLKAAIEGKEGLVDRYLPKLKSIEHKGATDTGLSELLADARALREAAVQPAQAQKEEKPSKAAAKH
ncbi:MAG: hypothetical protein AB2608_07935 [Candidatus Thiodiazotropha sp.]